MAVPRLVPGVIDSYIEARHKWFRGSHAPIDIIGLHVPVFPERLDGAERIARYFATTDRVASTAFCTDADSVVRCIDDDWYGASAVGANRNGVHFEMTGFADQTAAQWMDEFSVKTMERTAAVIALYVEEYDIPVKILSVAELLAGERGMAKHSDMVKAWGGDFRSDPGPNFPDDYFVDLVEQATGGALIMATGVDFVDKGAGIDPGDDRARVRYWQRILRVLGVYGGAVDGIYGGSTEQAVAEVTGLAGDRINNRAAFKIHQAWIQHEIEQHAGSAPPGSAPSEPTLVPHTHTMPLGVTGPAKAT